MILIRPIEEKDLKAFIALAMQSHLGMTHLPKNEKRLTALVKQSVASFQRTIDTPHEEFYLFVAEDTDSQELVGVAGILATTGPLHYFQMTPLKKGCLLKRSDYVKGPSELCSLFLNPNARKKGTGKLLSLSRLLFIANFTKRFTETVFAELRGEILDNGTSAFWDAVGKHFIPISFEKLQQDLDAADPAPYNLMPKHPIHLEDSSLVGKVHPHTKPALAILLNEGFHLTGEVDLFDGGPRLSATLSQLPRMQTIQKAVIGKVEENLDKIPFLLSNGKLQFRATVAPLKLYGEGKVAVMADTLKTLQTQIGEPIEFTIF